MSPDQILPLILALAADALLCRPLLELQGTFSLALALEVLQSAEVAAAEEKPPVGTLIVSKSLSRVRGTRPG